MLGYRAWLAAHGCLRTRFHVRARQIGCMMVFEMLKMLVGDWSELEL